jgi:hypothetical protein
MGAGGKADVCLLLSLDLCEKIKLRNENKYHILIPKIKIRKKKFYPEYSRMISKMA